MSVMPRPRVTIEPVNDGTDADRLLTAVEDMIERSNVLKRDGVVLSVEQPAADGGLTAFQASPTPEPDTDPSAADACPHDDVWEESGQCMACRPAVGARFDDGISDELSREQWGGR